MMQGDHFTTPEREVDAELAPLLRAGALNTKFWCALQVTWKVDERETPDFFQRLSVLLRMFSWGLPRECVDDIPDDRLPAPEPFVVICLHRGRQHQTGYILHGEDAGRLALLLLVGGPRSQSSSASQLPLDMTAVPHFFRVIEASLPKAAREHLHIKHPAPDLMRLMSPFVDVWTLTGGGQHSKEPASGALTLCPSWSQPTPVALTLVLFGVFSLWACDSHLPPHRRRHAWECFYQEVFQDDPSPSSYDKVLSEWATGTRRVLARVCVHRLGWDHRGMGVVSNLISDLMFMFRDADTQWKSYLKLKPSLRLQLSTCQEQDATVAIRLLSQGGPSLAGHRFIEHVRREQSYRRPVQILVAQGVTESQLRTVARAALCRDTDAKSLPMASLSSPRRQLPDTFVCLVPGEAEAMCVWSLMQSTSATRSLRMRVALPVALARVMMQAPTLTQFMHVWRWVFPSEESLQEYTGPALAATLGLLITTKRDEAWIKLHEATLTWQAPRLDGPTAKDRARLWRYLGLPREKWPKQGDALAVARLIRTRRWSAKQRRAWLRIFVVPESSSLPRPPVASVVACLSPQPAAQPMWTQTSVQQRGSDAMRLFKAQSRGWLHRQVVDRIPEKHHAVIHQVMTLANLMLVDLLQRRLCSPESQKHDLPWEDVATAAHMMVEGPMALVGKHRTFRDTECLQVPAPPRDVVPTEGWLKEALEAPRSVKDIKDLHRIEFKTPPVESRRVPTTSAATSPPPPPPSAPAAASSFDPLNLNPDLQPPDSDSDDDDRKRQQEQKRNTANQRQALRITKRAPPPSRERPPKRVRCHEEEFLRRHLHHVGKGMGTVESLLQKRRH